MVLEIFLLTYLYLLNQLSTRQLVRITVVDSDCYADIFHCNCWIFGLSE